MYKVLYRVKGDKKEVILAISWKDESCRRGERTGNTRRDTRLIFFFFRPISTLPGGWNMSKMDNVNELRPENGTRLAERTGTGVWISHVANLKREEWWCTSLAARAIKIVKREAKRRSPKWNRDCVPN